MFVAMELPTTNTKDLSQKRYFSGETKTDYFAQYSYFRSEFRHAQSQFRNTLIPKKLKDQNFKLLQNNNPLAEYPKILV